MLTLRCSALKLGSIARASTAVQPRLQRRIFSPSAERLVDERQHLLWFANFIRSDSNSREVYIGKFAGLLTALNRYVSVNRCLRGLDRLIKH
jgi:hypothetical protein